MFFHAETALPERNAAFCVLRCGRIGANEFFRFTFCRKYIFPAHFPEKIYIWRIFSPARKFFSALRGHSARALRAVKSCACGAGFHSNGRGAVPVLVCSFAGGADFPTLENFLRMMRRFQCGARSRFRKTARHLLSVKIFRARRGAPFFAGSIRDTMRK